MLHSRFKEKSCAICLNPCGYRHLLPSENGLNIKAKSKAGQVKEIVLTPTV